MKIFITFFILYCSSLIAQDLSVNVRNLLSSNTMTAWSAIKDIRNEMDTAAIPYMHKILEEKPPFLQLVMLKALMKMGDKSVERRTLDLIERADTFSKNAVKLDPLEAKVDATEILFDLGNYSTHNFVFQILEREKPRIYSTSMKLLPAIMKNVPEKKEQAKNELIFILKNNKESYYRLYAMEYLYNELEKDSFDLLKLKAEKDESPQIRERAKELLNLSSN